MNSSPKKAYAVIFVLGLLCSNCTQENQGTQENQRVITREENLYPYTLGPVTIDVPFSWRKRDYDPASEDSAEPHVFTNPAQRQDSLLGDAVMVIIKKTEGDPDLQSYQKHFVENMEVEGKNQVKMLSFQDSVFANRELVLIDYDNRVFSQNLSQVCTYGCYYRKGNLVSIVCMAQRGLTKDNQKKRELFRKIIYSVKWVDE